MSSSSLASFTFGSLGKISTLPYCEMTARRLLPSGGYAPPMGRRKVRFGKARSILTDTGPSEMATGLVRARLWPATGLWADECVADARTAAVMIRARTRAEIETELFMRGFEGRRDGGGARSDAQPRRQFDLWEKHSQSRFDLPLAAGWWAVGGETRRSRGEGRRRRSDCG